MRKLLSPDFTADPDLLDFAERTYRTYVEWFGAPADADWPYHLVRGNCNKCTRVAILHSYVITIIRGYQTVEQRKSSVAHEMYHRVTMQRSGLRQQLWVDEMLAIMAQYNILKREGMYRYAIYALQYHIGSGKRYDVHQLRNVPRRRRLFRVIYPPGFTAGIADLVSRLEDLIDWPIWCKLIHCTTWNEWIEFVPTDKRLQLEQLLHLRL
jgi:hypothetical protein